MIQKLKVIGILNNEPRIGKYGSRHMEIVKDIDEIFKKAYSPNHALLPLTFFGARAEFLGESQIRLEKLSARFYEDKT